MTKPFFTAKSSDVAGRDAMFVRCITIEKANAMVEPLLAKLKIYEERVKLAEEALERLPDDVYSGMLEKTAHCGWTERARNSAAAWMREIACYRAITALTELRKK